jgi:hypothetical protein
MSPVAAPVAEIPAPDVIPAPAIVTTIGAVNAGKTAEMIVTTIGVGMTHVAKTAAVIRHGRRAPQPPQQEGT